MIEREMPFRSVCRQSDVVLSNYMPPCVPPSFSDTTLVGGVGWYVLSKVGTVL